MCFKEEELRIIIPALVAITIFLLGLLTAYLRSNSERRRETKNLKNVITTWIPNLKKPVETLADSCKDIGQRLFDSTELTTEQFKYNHLNVSKIASIELTKMLKAFITNSTGDIKLKNSNIYTLVVTLEFLDKVESEIINKYKEHYDSTRILLKEWNDSFMKFSNLNQIVLKKADNKNEERLKLENELLKISNHWLQEINKKPRDIEVTFTKLVLLYDSAIANYFVTNGPKEDDLMELMAKNQDLKIIYTQWNFSKNSYSQIFKDYSTKLNNSLENLLNASNYFKEKTKVNWFCS